MSFKELLVTFVTSEEASITQRSVLTTGSALLVVMVAMLSVGFGTQTAKAADPYRCIITHCYWENTNPNCGHYVQDCAECWCVGPPGNPYEYWDCDPWYRCWEGDVCCAGESCQGCP